MRMLKIFANCVLLCACLNVDAQSIFNVQPASPKAVVGGSVPAATATPVQQPVVGVPRPVAQQQPLAASLVDPKVMAQFDQLPNESNEAYLVRLKTLSDKNIAEMGRTSAAHTAKMKALAPK